MSVLHSRRCVLLHLPNNCLGTHANDSSMQALSEMSEGEIRKETLECAKPAVLACQKHVDPQAWWQEQQDQQPKPSEETSLASNDTAEARRKLAKERQVSLIYLHICYIIALLRPGQYDSQKPA